MVEKHYYNVLFMQFFYMLRLSKFCDNLIDPRV